MAVSRLPGFAEGTVSVQDAGAQLAAPCWMCMAACACSMPVPLRGQDGSLLELLSEGADLTAVDIDADRWD